MAFLVVLVLAVVVLTLVVRAAAASGRPDSAQPAPRRPQGPVRPTAPDDDPEFLRELGRRVRKDDGSPA